MQFSPKKLLFLQFLYPIPTLKTFYLLEITKFNLRKVTSHTSPFPWETNIGHNIMSNCLKPMVVTKC